MTTRSSRTERTALNTPRSVPIDPTLDASSNVDLRSARNSAIAGYTAGFVGVVLGHPLDSLKVWAQTSSSGSNKHFAPSPPGSGSGVSSGASMASSSSSLSRPAARTMSTLATSQGNATGAIPSSLRSSNAIRTIRALYSGASGPLVTVGIVQSINFTTYDATRRLLHHRDAPNAPRDDYLHNDSIQNVAVAGFVAGTGLAFITSPLIMVKTQQQVTGNGFRQAFRETLFRTNGRLDVKGCFVGLYPHLLSETFGRALYYTVYETCKRQTAVYKEQQGLAPKVSLTERMGAAALAGITCWSAIFPLDALRNRLYSQAGRGIANPLSTLEMARSMYNERALYRGFSLTVLRAGPVAAAVLPIYDLVLEELSS